MRWIVCLQLHLTMLTKRFKESILQGLTSNDVQHYLNKAKSEECALLDEDLNWKGTSVEQTMFLVLLMQCAFDYNHTLEDEMPWMELGWLFNLTRTWKSPFRFSRKMASNYQRIVQTDSDARKVRYSSVYRLFGK